MEEEHARTLDRQLADLANQAPRTPLDRKRVVARLVALSRNVRGVLAAGGPEARCVLQRILNGRRVACEPFREPDSRGYRFRATGTYAGVLSSDVGGPNGKHILGDVDLGEFTVAGEALAA